MDTKTLLLALLSAIALGVLVVAFASADYSKLGSPSSGGCVGVLELNGEIVAQDTLSPSQVSEPQVRSALQSAKDDSQVSSILIVINSPGGSAAASKDVFDDLYNFSKPTVAYLDEEAASGGYYAASATNYIVANPNTLTGSIGARATVVTYADLLSKLGIQQDNLKTGQFKDIGDGNHNLTQAEADILQAILNETFDNFKADVQKGRQGKLNTALFSQDLDARVLSARQALAAGLVDQVGNRRVALLKAAALGKITDSEPTECPLNVQPDLFSLLLSKITSSIASGLASQLGGSSSAVQYK